MEEERLNVADDLEGTDAGAVGSEVRVVAAVQMRPQSPSVTGWFINPAARDPDR